MAAEDWQGAPLSVWWKPADDLGPACLSVEVEGGPKRFRRHWSPGTREESAEWGWSLADGAVLLWERPNPV